MKISTCSVSQKNLSIDQAFARTHRQTQRIHSWIALDLSYRNKLVPCELNTQILSYDHFSGQNLRKILRHSWSQFSLQPNYSKSGEGSTRHFMILSGALLHLITVAKRPRRSWEASWTILRNFEKVENFRLFGVMKKHSLCTFFCKPIGST